MLALVALGALFSFLASLMAFLITFNEYSKHFREKRIAIRSALGTAVVTFIVFSALSVAAGFVLSRVLAGGF